MCREVIRVVTDVTPSSDEGEDMECLVDLGWQL